MATLETGTDAYGGYVVSPDFRADVDAYVHSRSVFLSLATVLPVRRRTVHLHKVAAAPSLGWVAEGGTKTTTDLQFGRDTATVWELAGLLKWTDRLSAESFADPSIRALVRREIGNSAAQKIDSELFQGVNNTDNPDGPEGLLTPSSVYQEVNRTPGSDLGEDLLTCVRKVAEANFTPSAIVLPAAGLYGLMAVRDSDDHPKYPTVHQPRPTLWGLPVVTANNITTTTVTDGTQFDAIVAAWSRIIVCRMPGDIRITDSATVDGESLFEVDKSAIRYVANVSSPVVQRTNAVCILRDAIA